MSTLNIREWKQGQQGLSSAARVLPDKMTLYCSKSPEYNAKNERSDAFWSNTQRFLFKYLWRTWTLNWHLNNDVLFKFL